MNLNVGVSTNLSAFRALLDANPQASLNVELPDASRIPSHFHVTEVGRVRKDFIDCGGTVRSTERCVLQIWLAENDEDHRLNAEKLAKILDLAKPLLGSTDLALEVEYDVGVITQFPMRGATMTPDGILIRLDGKHTACLAPEKCGPKCC